MLRASSQSTVIYIGSELLGESAGTPRQQRDLMELINNYESVSIFTLVNSRWKCISYAELSAIPKQSIKGRRFTRNSALLRLMRFIKQDLLFEFITPRSVSLYVCLGWVCISKNINLVSVSSPPFPLFCIALSIFKIAYNIDMRDPWAQHPTLARFTYVRKRLERIVLRNAQNVTVATKYMAAEIFSKYSVRARVIYNLPDPHAHEFLPPDNRDMESLDVQFNDVLNDQLKKSLVYCGSTPDDFYDLDKIDQILYQSLANDKSLRIFFVGNVYRFKRLEKYVSEKRVTYVDRVPRKLALAYVQLSDYVLFFGHKFDGYLTTKLFEYFQLKKKIIPLDLDMKYEASDLIFEYGQEKMRIESSADFKTYIELLD